MPTYEFACESCGRIEEVHRPIKEGPPREMNCSCGGKMWHRMACEFVLKGGGWAGQEAKHGEAYRERWMERERDEENLHERDVAEKEAKEVMAARRRGRKASKEFVEHNAPTMKRYRENLRRGIGRNAGKKD